MKRIMKYGICGAILGTLVGTTMLDGPKFLYQTRQSLEYLDTGIVPPETKYFKQTGNLEYCLYGLTGLVCGTLASLGGKKKIKVHTQGVRTTTREGTF